MRLIIFFFLALFLLPVTRAANAVEGPFNLLFSTQMTIAPDGEPLIAVGVQEGQEKVYLQAQTAIEVSIFGEVEKKVSVPASEKLGFSLQEAAPAEIHFYPTLASIPWGMRKEREEAVKEWSERGIETEVVTVGAINGFKGTVLDNRLWLVLAKGNGEIEWANELIETLFKRFGIRASLHETLVKRPSGKIILSDSKGVLASSKDIMLVKPAENGLISLEPPQKNPHGWTDGKPRSYAGEFIVTVDKEGKLTAVNLLKLSRYLKSVVPSETYASAPHEALKAQAVAARGYILSHMGRTHLADPYHTCADVRCQVYSGVANEQPSTSRAVDDTRGEILFSGKKPLLTTYSANAGGFTENNETVWMQSPENGLRGKNDFIRGMKKGELAPGKSEAALRRFIDSPPASYSGAATIGRKELFRWTRKFTAEELNKLIEPLGIGAIENVTETGRGIGGRVKGIKIWGTGGSRIILYELTVRRTLGNLPSGLFYIERERDEKGNLVSATFKGGGWGHGVGMCQMGTIGRAEAGQNYKTILKHYYSGSEIRKLY